MTPEAQRIAIAEACGWIQHEMGHWTDKEGIRYITETGGDAWAPDYLNDLNAMHEAEKVLTEDQLNDYGAWLKGRDGETVSLHCPEHREIAKVAMATAAQRAEAFLRTIGKWQE